MRQLTIHEIRELSYEERLHELAKDLPSKRRLNLREYFQLLEWAHLFTVLPADGSRKTGIGYEIGGVHYCLLFTWHEAAAEVAAGHEGYVATRVRAREVLERIPDGWGVIVDYGTDGELRISPDQLTEENERIRIKPVRREANDGWLAEQNERLAAKSVPRQDRAAEVRKAWEAQNGFRVLPGSKRDRRIELYFAAIADATPDEAKFRTAEFWRRKYTADPYLLNLSDDDLRKRLSDIRANLMFADRDALPHEWNEREWRELLEHVRVECERRGLPCPDEISGAERQAAWPHLDRARDAYCAYAGSKGQLFKFGSSKYLEPMFRDGAIRLSPATRYADPSLLPSQRDDEIARSILLDSKEVRAEHTGSDGVRRPLNLTGTVKVTASHPSNFYVWCTTTTFDPRLFDDFEVDACLVIHDAHSFIERLHLATDRALPNWPGCEFLVHYFDPVRPGDAVLSARDKDLRYAYQREYRFLWDPPSPQRAPMFLQPIDLRLGSLADVASLIRL